MKYLIKADYSCNEVATGGTWFVIECETKPELKPLKISPLGRGLLPPHECRKYYESQICEEDETCQWQQILEVKQYSDEEAKKLHARGIPDISSLFSEEPSKRNLLSLIS